MRCTPDSQDLSLVEFPRPPIRYSNKRYKIIVLLIIQVFRKSKLGSEDAQAHVDLPRTPQDLPRMPQYVPSTPRGRPKTIRDLRNAFHNLPKTVEEPPKTSPLLVLFM
jgi:hypothetical protein